MAGGTYIRNCSHLSLTNGKLLKGYMILSIWGETQCLQLFSDFLQGKGSWRQLKELLEPVRFVSYIIQGATSSLPLSLAQSSDVKLTQERTGK